MGIAQGTYHKIQRIYDLNLYPRYIDARTLLAYDRFPMMKQNLFLTKRNLSVWIRPLQSTDTSLLVGLFENMSAESRYRRFHIPVDNPSPERVWETAEQIAQMPLERQVGFIAMAKLPDEGEVAIGAVRCVLTGPDVAEVAISVRDDMQNQGIGGHLLTLLVEEAQKRDIHTLAASVQSLNKPMRRLFEKMPCPLHQKLDGSNVDTYLNLTAYQSKLDIGEI